METISVTPGIPAPKSRVCVRQTTEVTVFDISLHKVRQAINNPRHKSQLELGADGYVLSISHAGSAR